MAIALHLVPFLIFSLAELFKSCGCSEGQKVAEPEWACCLAGESAAAYNKRDKRWEMLSGVYTHTLQMKAMEVTTCDVMKPEGLVYSVGGSVAAHCLTCTSRNLHAFLYSLCTHECEHAVTQERDTLRTHDCASFSGFVLTSSMLGLPGNWSYFFFFHFLFGFLTVLAASRQRQIERVFLVCAHYSWVWVCGQRCSCAHSEKTTL